VTNAELPDLSTLVVLDERLREVAGDRAAVEDALLRAAIELERADDNRARMRLLGYVGNAERALGRPDRALTAFRESHELATALGDRRGVTVALIRLGEAHRCADELGESERLLREALRGIDANASLIELRDFALQHLGKCLVEQGRSADAVPLLEEALERREAKDAAELVASTEAALEWARSEAERAT
jgi:tetratricopeptide (TPR) repeat protein